MKRRNEIFNVVVMIYGGIKVNKRFIFDGMFDILNKRCKLSDLVNYVFNGDNL